LLSDQRSSQRSRATPFGAWSNGEPVKLEADVRARLYDAVHINWQERQADARRLIQEVSAILGTHVEMSEELDKLPRTDEQLRLIRDCASRAEALLDSLDRLDVDTSDVINQVTGDADLFTFAESLRMFRNRLAMAERRLVEFGQDSGDAPGQTARATTLKSLAELFQKFAPEGKDADLVEFLRVACAAATTRAGKRAPIRLPARSTQILDLVRTRT
jgi:hypothetical protein